jgi:hypothetical protein
VVATLEVGFVPSSLLLRNMKKERRITVPYSKVPAGWKEHFTVLPPQV